MGYFFAVAGIVICAILGLCAIIIFRFIDMIDREDLD